MLTTGQHNIGFRMESVHRPNEHPNDSVYNHLNHANQTAAHAVPIPVDNSVRQPNGTVVVVNQKLIHIVTIVVVLSFLATIATLISALTMMSANGRDPGKRILKLNFV